MTKICLLFYDSAWLSVFKILSYPQTMIQSLVKNLNLVKKTEETWRNLSEETTKIIAIYHNNVNKNETVEKI